MTYSCGLLNVCEQRPDDPKEFIYNSSVPIQDIVLKTARERWTIDPCWQRDTMIVIVFFDKRLNVKTNLFETIQFNISTQYSSIWPVDRTLSGATTLGWNGLGINGNKVVLCIPQRSRITGTWPSDCFSVISRILVGGVLAVSREADSVFYSVRQHVNVAYVITNLSSDVLFKWSGWNQFFHSNLSENFGNNRLFVI